MIIQCPSCGFSQPQDKYCAQCGIDMETFVKVDKKNSLLKSPLILTILFILLAGTSSFLLFKKEQLELQKNIAFLQGKTFGKKIATQSLETKSNRPSESHDEAANTQVTVSSENKAVLNSESIEGNNTHSGTQELNPSSPAVTNENSSQFTLHIYYTEITDRLMNQIFEESSTTVQLNSFGDYSAGILPEFSKKINLSNPLVKIHHKLTKPLDLDKPITWFVGSQTHKDPDSDVGFLNYFELTEFDGNQYKGNLEIIRNWKDSPEASLPVNKAQYPAMLEMNKGFGFFITGLMPRISTNESNESLFKEDVFKILKSTQFKSKTSEFVIFFEIERN